MGWEVHEPSSSFFGRFKTLAFFLDLQIYGSTAAPRLAPGYMGVPKASVCPKGGYDYTLSGCVPKKCIAPSAKTSHAYEVKGENFENLLHHIFVWDVGAKHEK